VTWRNPLDPPLVGGAIDAQGGIVLIDPGAVVQVQGDLVARRQLVPLGKAEQQRIVVMDLDPADIDAGLLAGRIGIGGGDPEQGGAEKSEQTGW
jgi:hypothetical protein